MGNILKKELDSSCDEFLAEVYGDRTKPCSMAMKTLFTSILIRSSTLVKELSIPLRGDNEKQECKRVQEMVSRWLTNYDMDAELNQYLLSSAKGYIHDDSTLAIDFSDISKEFGGGGMEGMEMGWDGSRGCKAMGHDFIAVSLVGQGFREALPVYVKLGKGRHKRPELLYNAIESVMKATKGMGWMVLDRGMDNAKFVYTMKRNGYISVVRIKELGRDVFGNGKTIDNTLNDIQFVKAHLNTHRGIRKINLRFAIGIMQYCTDERTKDALTQDSKLLVVESRFDNRSIYLYVICPDEIIDDPKLAQKYALRAAQAYHDRWQIETSFQAVKQDFKLEEARVRTFKRLTNLFALCILAYVFMIQYLHSSHRFKKIVKVLGDNFDSLMMKAHPLLVGLRELYKAITAKYITGRPRKNRYESKYQMVFQLE